MNKRIITWLESIDSRILVITPINIGIILILIVAIAAIGTDSPLPAWVGNSFIITLALLMCLSGVMQIIKKEVPETPFRGRPAIIIGIVWVVLWGVVGITSVWTLIIKR